jgi:hypothetical protein
MFPLLPILVGRFLGGDQMMERGALPKLGVEFSQVSLKI